MLKYKSILFIIITIIAYGCKNSGQSNIAHETTQHENTGDWRIGNYIDKYGDNTNHKYLYINVSGECITTYKNILSTDFTLLEDDGDIRLYVEGLKPDGKYNLDYKNERTNKEFTRQINFYKGETTLFNFYNIINSGDKYSFYLWAYNKDCYRFKINFEGYDAARRKMMQ